MNMKKILAAASISAAAALASTPASAIPLTLDAGWSSFSFAGVGSTWSDDFTFTIASTAYFIVTDAFCAGDRFEFSVNGTVEGQTSVPFYDGSCTGATYIGTDADAAFASSYWSSGEIALAAGSYTITGTAVSSPFGSGGAYAQLSSTSLGGPVIQPPTVPLPAGGLLLLTAIGGIAGLRRRRRNA